MLTDKKKSRGLVSEFTMTAPAATMNPIDPAIPRLSSKEIAEMITIEETGTARRRLARAGTMIETASIDTATENIAQTTVTKTEGIENATELQMWKERPTFANTGTELRRGDPPGRKRIREHAGSFYVTPLTIL